MSLLIKGADMPKGCPCELLGIGYDVCCSFAGGIPSRVKEYYECCQNDTRPSWRPLVPVPPHGRLIDADALDMNYLHIRDDGMKIHTQRAIDNAPTIISAEEA